MKNISQVILLSTSWLICYGADNVCASVNVYSGIPKSGTHITHYTHYLAEPHLSSIQSNNKQRHPRRSAATSGDPGENIESLFNLDVRGKPEHDIRVASVCFITDAGNCSGEKFSNDETPGSGGNGNPDGIPDYDTPQEQCQAAGYGVTSCPAGSHGDNPCPADSAYYQKCVCDANMTQTCTKPYYGVGPSCDGKYASCEKDTPRACKEDGYGQSGACPDLQTPNKKCPYDNAYYDKCVCRSDLVTCAYPQTGVGEACGGKYASCQCPSSYKSCECGGAAGATSCTVNGVIKYSDCKSCCNSSSYNWCDIHGSCHGDCCTDGSIEPCDERCGGSGCYSSGGDSGSSGSGSDSEEDTGGDICNLSEPEKAELERKCECIYWNGTHTLYVYDHYTCINGGPQGSVVSNNNWRHNFDAGSYETNKLCKNAISEIPYCNEIATVTPNPNDQARCGWRCLD